ncbi:MAG: DHH family phosphoesterase [Thermoproteota archaeon]
MSKAVVLSHYDADGVTSATIIQNVVECDVRFQRWYAFGVHEDDVPFLSKYQQVFVTDLGSTKETLDSLKKVSEKNVQVTLIDHHVPYDRYSEYQSPNLNIIVDQKNCAAGLSYKFAKNVANVNGGLERYLKAVATVGIYADVSSESEGGSQLLEKFSLEGDDELTWKLVRWDGKSESRYTVASAIGAAINTCRRIAYDGGAEIARRFLAENNTYEKLLEFGLNEDIPTVKDVGTPYTAIVKGWLEAWRTHRNDCLSLDVCQTFEIDGLNVCFTTHPWDVAPYVAGVKSRVQPTVAVNYGVPSSEYASMSVRVPNNKMDANELLAVANEVSSGLVTGGGHPEAAGGLVSRKLSRKDVLKVFQQAVKVIGY